MFKETLEKYFGKYSVQDFGKIDYVQIKLREVGGGDYNGPLAFNKLRGEKETERLESILELLKYMRNGNCPAHIRNYFGKINVKLEKSEDPDNVLLILET